MEQVITVGKDGSLFGLDHKRKGLDLAKLGIASKERVSDIQWGEGTQKWFIKFIGNWKLSGQLVGVNICCQAGIEWATLEGVYWNPVTRGHCLYFNEYEQAVAAEVTILQGLQRRGYFNG